MPRAIVMRSTGGPEVLKIENLAEPKSPPPGHVILRHTALGINFSDTYYRTGIYEPPGFPIVPGIEGVGVVESVGDGVQNIKVGQRMAYATQQSGSYCEKRLIHAHFLVNVPDHIPDRVVAGALGKGLTAHYLLHRVYRVREKENILIHALAGGVGHVLCQWAKYLGVNVIGTVGSAEKLEFAKQCGADHIAVTGEHDFVDVVRQATNGEGVSVAYDSIGKDTFQKTLDALRPLGLMVSFGQASGRIPEFDILSLAQKGLFLTRPTLFLYKALRPELVLSAAEVFTMLEKGAFKVNIYKSYRFQDIPEAHADFASRKTMGSLIVEM